MTLVKDIFEADSIELHDLRDNPNTIVKIQSLISEWLTANDMRRLGIQQMLLQELGVSALPGLISSTYILNSRLGHKADRDKLAEMMVELSKDNPYARSLLLKAGIIENPFEQARKLAFAAINKLNTGISESEKTDLLKSVKMLDNESDRDGVLLILEILMKQSAVFQDALLIGRRWLASKVDAESTAILVDLLIEAYPSNIESVMSTVLELTDPADKIMGQEIQKHVNIPDSSTVITTIKTCSSAMRRSMARSNKVVENLFRGAIARHIAKDKEALSTVGSHVESSHLDSKILRYWWQAVSSAVERKSEHARAYMHEKIVTPKNANPFQSDFLLWGCVQLLFLTDDGNSKDNLTWAQSELSVVEDNSPDLFEEATDLKEKFGKAKDGPSYKKILDAKFD